MKKIRKLISILAVVSIIFSNSMVTANAGLFKSWIATRHKYEVSTELKKEMENIYNQYNFSIGWGLYDISGKTLEEVVSYNTEKLFQSNCTIKAAMLLYICKLMDSGQISKETKMSVNKRNLHYNDFPKKSGKYSVEYIATKMINVSNNACYEIFLRFVTKENFNKFLKKLGSGTEIKSYNFMGNCLPKDRAIEWFAIYKYCHSNAKNAKFAWNLFVEAKYSPVRDGLEKTVAHKSGWYYKKGTKGTAGDCAIVKTENGGCYLIVIFTKNNNVGNYSKKIIQRIAITGNKIWNEYYNNLFYPKTAEF